MSPDSLSPTKQSDKSEQTWWKSNQQHIRVSLNERKRKEIGHFCSSTQISEWNYLKICCDWYIKTSFMFSIGTHLPHAVLSSSLFQRKKNGLLCENNSVREEAAENIYLKNGIINTICQNIYSNTRKDLQCRSGQHKRAHPPTLFSFQRRFEIKTITSGDDCDMIPLVQ